MKTINCIIVDDEELSRVLVSEYVQKLPYLNLVAQFKNPLEALRLMREQKIDLIFLDIQMPEITGIDFIKTLQYSPDIILTTAYDNYALQGFDLNVTDYLLKPFSFNRFVQAVEKVNHAQAVEIKVNTPDFISVNADYKRIKIVLKNILYIEGMREYVRIHQMNGPSIMTLDTLQNMEQKLNDQGFIRVHKSYIVNKRHIQSYNQKLIFLDKHEIPIGNKYSEHVNDSLFG